MLLMIGKCNKKIYIKKVIIRKKNLVRRGEMEKNRCIKIVGHFKQA